MINELAFLQQNYHLKNLNVNKNIINSEYYELIILNFWKKILLYL